MTPFERLQKLNTKENLWLYILVLLEKKPNHAWEILSLIEKEFGFRPGTITPYRVLYRLEDESLVKSKLRARRRVYHITLKGKEELKRVKAFYRNLLSKIP
ncbi:MAG: helix-turn-helix transcriptional regulator [Candidatus Paceibacterota bacterium]|jgi:DNA-binding PadR family transcriptional regulator|nr:helix-turn-helix transcriptional regulator [Candidatus Paceibacterota bacterium]MDD5555203.1 helix-turn-helix transcriptional regulator [Candidatus Paceibacterota bacterium]